MYVETKVVVRTVLGSLYILYRIHFIVNTCMCPKKMHEQGLIRICMQQHTHFFITHCTLAHWEVVTPT